MREWLYRSKEYLDNWQRQCLVYNKKKQNNLQMFILR